MKIMPFSFKKLITDLVIAGSFVYSNLYLTNDVVNVYIWGFWVFSILTLLGALAKPVRFFTKYRANQTIISELTFSLILVYFGYPVLATVGFVSGLLYAGSRSRKIK